jgi:hypothetical protein
MEKNMERQKVNLSLFCASHIHVHRQFSSLVNLQVICAAGYGKKCLVHDSVLHSFPKLKPASC